MYSYSFIHLCRSLSFVYYRLSKHIRWSLQLTSESTGIVLASSSSSNKKPPLINQASKERWLLVELGPLSGFYYVMNVINKRFDVRKRVEGSTYSNFHFYTKFNNYHIFQIR
jgi:hypothetical protein